MTIVVDRAILNLIRRYGFPADPEWQEPARPAKRTRVRSLAYLDLLMQAGPVVCVVDPRMALFFQIRYDVSSTGDIPPEISRDSIILIDADGEPPVLISQGKVLVNPLFLQIVRLYRISL